MIPTSYFKRMCPAYKITYSARFPANLVCFVVLLYVVLFLSQITMAQNTDDIGERGMIVVKEDQTTERLALVIGNADYTKNPLKNTLHDAEDIGKALQELGFEVTLKTNVQDEEMVELLEKLEENIKNKEAVFYYAGHGVQIDGINYLLPVDVKASNKAMLQKTSTSIDLVLEKMKKARVKILILDACRDNPYDKIRGRKITSGRGLAVIKSTEGDTIIIFATEPGQIAEETGTNGRNGLFTEMLLKHIKTPGQSISDCMIEVTNDVVQNSKEIPEQRPWIHSSLTTRFCFNSRQALPRVLVQLSGPADGIIIEDIIYAIDVQNVGEAEANDIVLKHTLPKGMSYRECSITPSNVKDNVLTWNLGNLAVNASKRLILKVRADETGLQKNIASVTSREIPNPQESYVTTTIGAPKIYLTKTGTDMVRKDNMVRYTVTIKNNGDAVAKDLIIEDVIPSGMQFRNQSGAKLTWRISTLQPGESKSFQYDLLANQTGTFINTARVLMQKQECHKTEFTTRVIAPDLTCIIDGDSYIFLDCLADYIITVQNRGDATAKDMVLVNTLSQELNFVSSDPMPTMFKPATATELATATWRLGDIQPKQTISIPLEARANMRGYCRNTVKLRSNSEELPKIHPLEAYWGTNIHGVPAIHINSYDLNDPIKIGKETIYIIEVRDEGTAPCSEVTMESQLDEKMEFVRAEGPTAFRVEDRIVYFSAVPVLQPTEKLVYKITARAIQEGSAKHRATLRYKEFDKPIICEEGTTCYKAN